MVNIDRWWRTSLHHTSPRICLIEELPFLVLGDGGGTPTSSMLDNDAPDKTVQISRLLGLQNDPIVSGLCSTTSSTCSSYNSGHVAHVALQVAGFKGRNLWKLWKKNRINHDKSTRCCWMLLETYGNFQVSNSNFLCLEEHRKPTWPHGQKAIACPPMRQYLGKA